MKEITRTIELPDGRILPLTTDRDDIKVLRQDLRNNMERYRQDPSLRNYIQIHHFQALIQDVKGNTKEAAEELLIALDPDNLEALYPGEDMKTLLQYQDAGFLLVELLLLSGRIEDALGWAEALYENAEECFYGTEVVPYARVLYGGCLEAAGRKSNAGYMYECALSESQEIIEEMQAFQESVKSNLSGLWGQK